jgi:hypothetical protein
MMASKSLKKVRRFFTKFRVVEVNSITFILVWDMPAVPGGKWHWGLLNLKVDQPKTGAVSKNLSGEELEALGNHAPHLSMRGLTLWSLSLACAGYLMAAGYLYQRLESRYPKIELSYLDLALPTRWSDLNRKRGDALIVQGRERMEEEKVAEGFSLIRQGLARNPEDFSARLDIARVYAGMRILPQAIKLLRDGFTHGYPGKTYLETLFGLLSTTDQTELGVEVVQTARTLFAARPAGDRLPAEQRFLDESLANAFRDAGRVEEAAVHVATAFPADDLFALKFLSQLHLAQQPRESARIAEKWAALEPANPEPLCVLIVALRNAKDFAAMDAALDRLSRIDPARPDALLYRVVQNHLAGRPAPARAAMDRLFLRHGSSPAFYAVVCASFLGTGYVEGFDRVENELRERGLSLHPVLWARVKLAAERSDWAALLTQIDQLRAAPGPGLKRDEVAYLDTMAKLARACLDGGSGTQRSLIEVVGDNPGALLLYKTVITALLDAGRPQTARQILVLAEGPFPDARTLRELRPRLETALAAATAAEPVAAASSPRFATWEEFKTSFETQAATAPAAALTLLSENRRAQPAWLEEHRAELEALELPLRARADDPLLLQVLVRAVLGRDAQAPATLLPLARAIQPSFPANARLILKETLRVHPENEDALALQRVWEPATAAPQP